MIEKAVVQWSTDGDHTARSAIADLKERNADMESELSLHPISIEVVASDEAEGLRTAHANLLDIHEALDQEYANLVTRHSELQDEKTRVVEALTAAHQEIRALSAMKADLERAAAEAEERAGTNERALHQTAQAYDELRRASTDLEGLRMQQMGRVVDAHLEIVGAAQEVVEYQAWKPIGGESNG